MPTPTIQEEAQSLQQKLLDTATVLSRMNAQVETTGANLRDLEQKLEQSKQLLYAEQVTLGDSGILKGAKNAETREAQFAVFLLNDQQHQVLIARKKKAETEVMNSKIEQQDWRLKFDALKSICDLLVARLGYESQLIAAETVTRQIAERTSMRIVKPN